MLLAALPARACFDYTGLPGTSPGEIVREAGVEKSVLLAGETTAGVFVAGQQVNFGFLDLLDGSDPGYPFLDGVTFAGVPQQMVVRNDRVLLSWYLETSGQGGIYMFAVAPDGQLSGLTGVVFSGRPTGLQMIANEVYLAVDTSTGSGYISVMVSGETGLSLSDYWPLPFNPNGLAMDGTRLYLAGEHYLEIYQTGDPTIMDFIEGWWINRDLQTIAVRDGIIYSTTEDNLLFAMDIFIYPGQLSLRSSLNMPGGARGMTLHQDALYLWNDDLHVVDVSDPGEIAMLGHVDTGDSGDAFVFDERLWHAAGPDGLELLPLQCPVEVPALLAGFSGEFDGRAVRIEGQMSAPVDRLDIRNAHGLLPVSHDGDGGFRATDPSPDEGTNVYELMVDGLAIAELRVDVSKPLLVTRLMAPYPNPFNPRVRIDYELASPGFARISICDARGRELKVLENGVFAAGERSVVWSGVDDRGAAMSSGVYLVRMSTESGIETRKITLSR
jgi:flagellar hook capping protein FlgD